MKKPVVRLSKPVYEALPYVYIAAGLLACTGSYFLTRHPWSDLVLVLGIACVLGGLVLVLKRRAYRASRAEYRGTPLDEENLR